MLNGLDKRGWKCSFQSHNYIGQTLPKGSVRLADGTPFNFDLYGHGREQYARDLLQPRVRELRPQIFGVLLDTFMLYPWYLQQNYAPAKTMFYFPSDGGACLPQGCEAILQKCDLPIAMSKFGQKQVKEIHGINAEYIPHAVDPKIYYPLEPEEKQKLKAKLGLSNKFVIGVMGRNQGRKMHDRIFKMFAKFAKMHQDVILFCHFDPNDLAAVFDVKRLMQRLNVANRVVFSGVNYFRGFTYEQMNEVYNVMDVYLSTTSGEGFGIGTIEAMACKIPVINIAYTTTEELVIANNAGESIKLVGCEEMSLLSTPSQEFDYKMMNGTITGSWCVERGICDLDDGVKKLEKLYQDAKLREDYGRNGRRAVLRDYTWDVVNDEFDRLLTRLVKS